MGSGELSKLAADERLDAQKAEREGALQADPGAGKKVDLVPPENYEHFSQLRSFTLLLQIR